jgi:peptidylprolyl isomerase
MRRLAACLAVLLLLLAAAACGDDGSSEDTTTEGAAADSSSLDAITVEGEMGTAPVVNFASPFSVDETVSKVLVEGDGEELTDGVTVGFDYVALNGRDGNVFDSSYEEGPVSGMLAENEILPGLVKGLLGTTVGSRVLIAMPPDDAFGPAGGASDVGIEKDDTLVWVVDVHELRDPLERAEGTPVDPVDGLPTVSLDDTGKPTITVPDAEPPAELVSQVLIEGAGDVVEAGQSITVHYTGIVWGTGEQFDSSWDRGAPASFPIGTGSVIDGWDTGLVGQKIGSQVLLVVPPDQGYGPDGNPDAGISGTDTLVFVVDILDAY